MSVNDRWRPQLSARSGTDMARMRLRLIFSMRTIGNEVTEGDFGPDAGGDCQGPGREDSQFVQPAMVPAGLNHGGTATLNGSRVSGNSAANSGVIASGPGNPTSPVTSSSLTLNGTSVDHSTATLGLGEGAAGGIANGGLAVIRGGSVTDNAAPGGLGGASPTTAR
jgi:hypothetical protein